MIELSNVSKRFGDVVALSHIHLKITPGEIVGLLGPNGAGKTTTMRIMAGVLPQSSGTFTIDGETFLDNEHALKRRIGYLPENNPLYQDLTVEEHLHFWGALKGLEAKTLVEAIEFAVASTGIAEVYYRFIGTLSKGYRQRVGLAQAILSQPDILLLDEPTEGLDPNQRRDIQDLLSTLKKDRTVIVSSHVLAEISKLANRIVIIHNGKVVGDDSPSKLVTSRNGEQLIEAEIIGSRVISTLKKHKRIVDAKRIATNIYAISFKGKDIREDLFDMAVKHSWKLLSSELKQRALEDVFTELTAER